MDIETKTKKLKTVRPIKVCNRTHIPFDGIVLKDENIELFKNKTIYAEPTGTGNLLVVDGFFGRMIRASEKFVRDKIDEYCEEYKTICKRLDEDPAAQYFEVMSYNDLYYKLHLIPSIVGDQWGYTNSEDYRVNLKFYIHLFTDGPWVERFHEQFLYFVPYEYCSPDPCYLEV